MSELLFEIGCEEIPARVGPQAVRDLARLLGEALAGARLTAGRIDAYGTPRRLVAVVRDLAERQPDLRETILGPAVAAGDKARAGFARKHGVDPAALAERDGRLVLERATAGRPASEVLPALLRGVIEALPFPRPMRWGEHPETFIRPVLWMVALCDGGVVPVEFAGVTAGRWTRGHRFLSPGPFNVGSFDEYREALARAHVELDPAERRARVWDEVRAALAAAAPALRVRPDQALLDEVAWLVEEPVALAGEFDPAHLRLPEAVIVSAMRAHLRFFAVEDGAGRLAPRFVAVAGTRVRRPEVALRGYQRVLAARLADARFFFAEDRRAPLASRRDALAGVVFHRKLGSVGDKAGRIEKIAERLAGDLASRNLVPAEDAAHAVRAARLCKCDLVTHLVGEFPDLQGVVGAEYARHDGEPAEVAAAIEDHYLPRFAGDRLPATAAGAVLSLADRIDSLVGLFSAGQAPTGAADPFALRRASLGLVRILIARGWPIGPRALADTAADCHGTAGKAAVPAVVEFLVERARTVLGEDAPADAVSAVLSAGADDLPDAAARLRALLALRARPDFEPLAIAFKRVANILRGVEAGRQVDEALLLEPSERELWQMFQALRVIQALSSQGERDYGGILAGLAELKPAVDRFFDDVLVMDKDERIRRNRLSLLGAINRTFLQVADFRELAVGDSPAAADARAAGPGRGAAAGEAPPG